MRYLAIDYGSKRTGLAICDANETIASPLVVIDGQGALIEKIVKIVESNHVGAVVLGLPLNMDGSEGLQSGKVRNFAMSLGQHIEVPIYFQDERLSSFAAYEKLAGKDLKKSKVLARLDAVAAAEILEAFLTQKKTPQHPDSNGSLLA
jgi:putative Holliday junction resolvase